MSVTFDDVRHIASLARLGVADDNLPVLARELSAILEHMAVLSRVDTRSVVESPPAVGTRWRADAPPPLRLHRPLAAFAPEVRDGFIVLPRLATHATKAAPGTDRPVDLDGHA